MAAPQGAIFSEEYPFHHHLEYRLTGAVADLVPAITAIRKAARDDDNVEVLIGFGAEVWQQLDGAGGPAGLRPFESVGPVAGAHAPATQNDVWIWLQGQGPDVLLDVARRADHHLCASAERMVDVAGFSYHGNRDLIGFVDGTANPKDREAKEAAALIPGRGGAFAFTQKWLHDLDAFNALTVADQEAVVGRTKVDDIELEGDAMPADSHVSRTDASLDGVALKIYRRSTPYGTVGEHGLFFVAFACDLMRVQVQLERMYGVAGDGLYDRLIDYSTAVTGSYWYVPEEAELSRLFG